VRSVTLGNRRGHLAPLLSTMTRKSHVRPPVGVIVQHEARDAPNREGRISRAAVRSERLTSMAPSSAAIFGKS
jgi:hypothetical protein